MGESGSRKQSTVAMHQASTGYAVDRVWDLRERHSDLTVAKLLAILEKDAFEALVEVDPMDATERS